MKPLIQYPLQHLYSVQPSGDGAAGHGEAPPSAPPPAPPPAQHGREEPEDVCRRRVTFNPQVEESLLKVSDTPPTPATLKEVADVVVRCLDPFYKQGKFCTKVRGGGSAPPR